VSLTTFPDIIGVSALAANAGASLLVPRGQLNILSTGVTAVDNPGRRRTDVTFPDPAFVAVTGSTSSSGEWQPAISGTANADLVRVSSSTTGTVLTGADFSGSQTKLTKFFANTGTNSIAMQPPASVVAGHAYFANSFTLRANETVRAVWDVVSLVYRIQSASVATITDHIVLDGVFVDVDASRVLKP
jgi:hypothetical protein